ncbi:hypothetical protein [Alicyclobacillus fastidiosus]|uniref:HPr kinase n=1 Tax=Alicyclobacillus fastidiosus TaxID=392011 RepID=A0ABV5AC94_9BACL|nr:hypothetical protein [Alicyclobacillus fastidiosus]WEH07609.1 hypothetical protein PYS47_12590 [Alicyclobacillus fastidiosus]
MDNLLCFEIGEHTLQVSTPSQRIAHWFATAFPAPLSPAMLRARVDLNVSVEDGYGRPFENFHVDISRTFDTIEYRRSDYLLRVDQSYTTATISVYDEIALKHAIMNLYSAFLVHTETGLLVHSSCVVDRGKAFLFSGYSGVGKSTVAWLSRPRPLLSNEATIVKIGDSEASAINSFPFRSEEGLFTGGQYPLEAIHLLHQSANVMRLPISPSAALLQLMDKVFFWPHDPAETAKVLSLTTRLVHQVRTYELHFQKNDSFWREIS